MFNRMIRLKDISGRIRLKNCKRLYLLIAVLIPLSFTSILSAAEFRTFKPIPIPASVLSPATEQQSFVPVNQAKVKNAVERLMEAWNKPQLTKMVSERFYDKDRLVDAVNTKAPRDAKIRVLSIQGIQTLQQETKKHPKQPDRMLVVSRVSVTVKTQIEFNDPVNGFQRREGTNEYILRVTQ